MSDVVIGPRRDQPGTPRLTDTQRRTLRGLLRGGDSDRLTHFESRGLASLERRGLVVQSGGRRPQGRGALRVLSDEGRRVAELLVAVVLEVHGWHTQCGACDYGRGGWASSPALEDKPILTPRSIACPGCGKTFTHRAEMYGDGELRPIRNSEQQGDTVHNPADSASISRKAE